MQCLGISGAKRTALTPLLYINSTKIHIRYEAECDGRVDQQTSDIPANNYTGHYGRLNGGNDFL